LNNKKSFLIIEWLKEDLVDVNQSVII